MSEILNGSEIASRVLGSTGGAAAKHLFKIDTSKFAWVESYLRDEALRNKSQALREDIQKVQASPIHRDELKEQFTSALSSIRNAHLQWLVEMLRSVQDRQGPLINSNMLQRDAYAHPLKLSKTEVENLFLQLPPGVKQADIDADVKRLKEEITVTEDLIARVLSPPERWIYRDDGKPHPYPQGCRWTQYVTAWKKVVTRFDGPVSMEGLSIESDSEMAAYVALGLNKISRITPVRKPWS